MEKIVSWIAPHRCIECKKIGEILCQLCAASLIINPPSRCYRCHSVTKQSQVCVSCRKLTRLNHVWVASEYQDLARILLKKFKFERARAVYKPVASSINQTLPLLPDSILVVHIPTANSRVRMRGYDQARLVAKQIARGRKWRHQTVILRRGGTRQVGSNRNDRFIHLEKAFIPIRKSKIKNAHILLIDDVTTTGATIEAAAKVLKQAGAKTIDAAVFAQA